MYECALTFWPREICRGNDAVWYDPSLTANKLRVATILQCNHPAEGKDVAGNLRVSTERY